MLPVSRLLSCWIRWRVYALPVAVLLAFTIPGINQGWPRTDSHRYTALALQMIESGEWVYPSLGDLPYFNKPVLTFWIHAAFFRIAGIEPGDFAIWAMRVPVIVAGIFCVLLTVDLVRRLGAGRRVAMFTGIVLASTLEFFRYTHAFSLDIWLTMWMLLLAWSTVRASNTERIFAGDWWRWTVVAGIATGCALMTKPFMVLMPIVILALWGLLFRNPRALTTLSIALITGILLAAPWHIAMALHWGDAFTRNYLITESVDRVRGRFEEPSPWYRYLRTLGKWYWPWMIGLAGFFWLLVRQRVPRTQLHALTLAALWAGIWLVALSLVGDKRGRYIVPIYPFLSIFSAVFLAYALPVKSRRSGRIPMLWLAPIMLGIGFLLTVLPIHWHKPITKEWPTITAWMDENAPGQELWTIETHNSSGAHPYILRGWTMRLIGPSRFGYGTQPPPNAIVLFRHATYPLFAELGEPVLKAGPYQLMRLYDQWYWPEGVLERLSPDEWDE